MRARDLVAMIERHRISVDWMHQTWAEERLWPVVHLYGHGQFHMGSGIETGRLECALEHLEADVRACKHGCWDRWQQQEREAQE